VTDDGTAALVAEAAVLEAAGITEAAEIDEEAVAVLRRTAAHDESPREPDLEAMVLAEEAALEAEELEAERLELARLAAARATAADADAAAAARRQRQRMEALGRFQAQREEAELLLAAQQEQEAKSRAEVEADGPRRPLMAADLDLGYQDDFGRPAAADEAPLPEAATAYDDPLWPSAASDDLEPASPLEPAQANAPTIGPAVPDEAVADLDKEPTWGVGPRSVAEPEPEPLHAAMRADDLWPDSDEPTEVAEPEPEPLHAAMPTDDSWVEVEEPTEAAGSEPGTWDSWVSANPVSWARGIDEDAAQPADPDPARPSSESDFVPPAHRAPPVEEVGGPLPQFQTENHESTPEGAWEPEVEDASEEDPAAEDATAETDTRWIPRQGPAPTGRRRPLMTGDFDDVLPEDLIDDEEDEKDEVPVPTGPPLRRSGRPRVPLKARRTPPADEREASAPQSRTPVTTVTKKVGPTNKVGTTTRKATATPKGASAEPATARRVTSTQRAPRAKKVADVLWVEPVGEVCPTSHPVKAVLSRGIFHVVGGVFYERTRPERCYRVPAAAEADGLRQAKR